MSVCVVDPTVPQGIVSVLAEVTVRPAASLRRTLSADMMSKTWLSQNGVVSGMKKIASSEQLCHCISEYSSSGDEEDDNYEKVKEKPAELDIWSLIVSQNQDKDREQGDSGVPYIHPLVKKSSGALSKNSLAVCTESLGSETGSDGFSTHPPSEISDSEEEKTQQQPQQRHNTDYEDVKIAKYNFTGAGKKLSHPCFPPPLLSLSSRGDGASLQMKPRRENGRLVLEAVSVSAQNNFKAKRHDGRLVLTFLKEQNKKADQFDQSEGIEEMEEFFGQDSDSESDDEDEKMDIDISRDTQTPKLSCRVIKLHRLALTINKSAILATMNNNYNNKVVTETEQTQLSHSLPPVGRFLSAPPAGAAASLNAYEYCWRDKPTAAQAMGKNIDNNNKHVISKKNSSIIENNKQEWKATDKNYAIQSMTGCKDHRRSLFREPYCIAT